MKLLKKSVTYFFCIILVMSFIPIQTICAYDKTGVQEEREVYLHVTDNQPHENSQKSTTVYMGDKFNLYMAVDNPNKGEYDRENKIHTEPYNDMNGYTVKFYYDASYLELTSTNPERPINFKIPVETWKATHIITDGTDVTEELEIGFYEYRHGVGTEVINGKTYNTAYATIMFSGSWVPNKDEGDETWYDLCALPFKPLRTGYTDVFIEIAGSDEYTLELLAKDVDSDYYRPFFDFEPVNEGHHMIIIKDRTKPSPPNIIPESGRYSGTIDVEITADADCEIWYNINGGMYQKYEGSFECSDSCTVSAYAERISDGQKSSTVSRTYEFVPAPPYAFVSDKSRIPGVYRHQGEFNLFLSDNEEYSNISDGIFVYYTTDPSATMPEDGETPDMSKWKQAGTIIDNQHIPITKSCVLRAICRNSSGFYSEEARYKLRIIPEPVVSSLPSGTYESSRSTVLTTETAGADIYYTVDGKDPRTSGILYEPGAELNITKDTALRCVSCLDGEFSSLSTYYYFIDKKENFGIEAVPAPGIYEGSVDVILIREDSDNLMYIKLNDGEYRLYEDEEVLEITENTIISAYCVSPDGTKGEEYQFRYKVKPLPPILSPESTEFTSVGTVTIYLPNEKRDCTLYYTTDGSDPRTNGISAGPKDYAEVKVTEYTVISAVSKNKSGEFSDITTGTYDVVTGRPAAPRVTLAPGYYTLTKDMEEGYSTQFMPVPEGVTVYYTIGHKYDGTYMTEDPVPGKEGTIRYVPGDEIPVNGETIIKAIAVDKNNVRSHMEIFDYTVIPEAPVAPESCQVTTLPVIPVYSLEGIIKYELNDFHNEFLLEGQNVFYLDTATGNAFADEECTELLGTASGEQFETEANLYISCEVFGVESPENRYTYIASGEEPEDLPVPYADMASGEYPEKVILTDPETGEEYFLNVHAGKIGEEGRIQYRTNSEEEWKDYSESGICLNRDAIIYLRTIEEKETQEGGISVRVSKTKVLKYSFYPMAPVITLPSGVYNSPMESGIVLREDAPTTLDYDIWYRNSDMTYDFPYSGGAEDIAVDYSMSIKAYVINNETGRSSEDTTANYIIEKPSPGVGIVQIEEPYDTQLRFSTHVLTEKPYSEGIKLYTKMTGAKIYYTYSYMTDEGEIIESPELRYTGVPVLVSPSMRTLSLHAWLVDGNGARVEGSDVSRDYEFIDLGIPHTSLYGGGKTEYPKGTEYTILNEYEGSEKVRLYYTQDGRDPRISGKMYVGEKFTLESAVTIKAVYCDTCGVCNQCRQGHRENCEYPIFGEISNEHYTIPGGGGGGGGDPATYTVSFEENGGTAVSDLRVSKGTAVDFSRYTSSREGYEFTGWYRDSALNEKAGTVTVNSDITVYAGWKEKAGGDNLKKYRPSILKEEHDAYIVGREEDAVEPEANITRAEVATVFYRLLKEETRSENMTDNNTFDDSNPGNWFNTAVSTLAGMKLIEGRSKTEFDPDTNITRAEFATIAARMSDLNYEGEDEFIDIGNHWARANINKAAYIGWIIGEEDLVSGRRIFRPDDFITRAEVMTLVNRMLVRLPEDVTDLLPGMKTWKDNSDIKMWYYLAVQEAGNSHDYDYKTDGMHEKWTVMREARDWTLDEK